MKFKATVIRSMGLWCEAELDDGSIWVCRMRGIHRLQQFKTSNPVAVGDRVQVTADEKGDAKSGMITDIEPRRNYVLRQSPHRRQDLHMLAANIDQALLVTTVVDPSLKLGLVDRFLLSVEPYAIPVIIAFNKADLYDKPAMAVYEMVSACYREMGYEVLLLSAQSGQNIEQLRKEITGRITLIGGQSGVGKSSLLNAIEPGLGAKVGEISEFSGKGQHTTTFAQMHKISEGGRLIDTPGIKSLSFNHLQPRDVADNFRDLFELSSGCRFNNCMHRNEPGCAVLQALDDESLYPWRYDNYLALLSEIESQNYWEIRDDM